MSIGTYSVLLCDCDDLELSLRLSFTWVYTLFKRRNNVTCGARRLDMYMFSVV